jgi:hypothetical protein
MYLISPGPGFATRSHRHTPYYVIDIHPDITPIHHMATLNYEDENWTLKNIPKKSKSVRKRKWASDMFYSKLDTLVSPLVAYWRMLRDTHQI